MPQFVFFLLLAFPLFANDCGDFYKRLAIGLDAKRQAEIEQGIGERMEDLRTDWVRARTREIINGLNYLPTTKKPVRYEPAGKKVSSEAELDSMRPLSFAEVEVDGLQVRTITSDGLETVNVANKSDVVMSGPSGEKYVIKGAKFLKLYTQNADGSVIPEQSPRMVARFTGQEESTITAPWGEEMVVKPGDYIVKEGDGKFYRIAQKEYEATYHQPGF